MSDEERCEGSPVGLPVRASPSEPIHPVKSIPEILRAAVPGLCDTKGQRQEYRERREADQRLRHLLATEDFSGPRIDVLKSSWQPMAWPFCVAGCAADTSSS